MYEQLPESECPIRMDEKVRQKYGRRLRGVVLTSYRTPTGDVLLIVEYPEYKQHELPKNVEKIE